VVTAATWSRTKILALVHLDQMKIKVAGQNGFTVLKASDSEV
jgi:hypothetical protein